VVCINIGVRVLISSSASSVNGKLTSFDWLVWIVGGTTQAVVSSCAFFVLYLVFHELIFEIFYLDLRLLGLMNRLSGRIIFGYTVACA
jgi:hypothetical protein